MPHKKKIPRENQEPNRLALTTLPQSILKQISDSIYTTRNSRSGASPCPVHGSSYLCLISGMLMQLAAATAAKGTKRPISGETRCRKESSGNIIVLLLDG